MSLCSSYFFGRLPVEPLGGRFTAFATFPRMRSKSFRLGIGILAPFGVSCVGCLSSVMI